MFKKELERDALVNNLGTGTVAFHSGLLRGLDLTHFGTPGMADLHLSVFCKQRNIPMIALARPEDWKLAHAGKRVQIIKGCHQKWGKLEFGTEIVAAEDGSLAALLGASPGASVSVKTMLDVLARCFPQQMQSAAWQDKLKAMIPSYGRSLITDAELSAQVRAYTLDRLKLSV